MLRETWISLGIGAAVAGLCGALAPPSWGLVSVGMGAFVGIIAALAAAAVFTTRARR